MNAWKAAGLFALVLMLGVCGWRWKSVARQRHAQEERATAYDNFRVDFDNMLTTAAADNQEDFVQAQTKAIVDMGLLQHAWGVLRKEQADQDLLGAQTSDCFQQAMHFNAAVHMAHTLNPATKLPVATPEWLQVCVNGSP